MIISCHPTGNANVKYAMQGFSDANLLAEYRTGLAFNERSVWLSAFPHPIQQELRRRVLAQGLASRTICGTRMEAARLFLGRLGGSASWLGSFVNVDRVHRQLDLSIAVDAVALRKRGVSAVYGYEDGALESFIAFKTLGLSCLYDLPIGYWRVWSNIRNEEADLLPEWASTLQGCADMPEKLLRKDEELRLADRVIVASSFTKSTLAHAPINPEKVRIVRYGMPVVHEACRHHNRRSKLKLLFVGALSQRKGLAYLFSVVSRLRRFVELTLVGQMTNSHCRPLVSALNDWKWYPTLPHSAVLELMRMNDILVFPSLFEGSGLVILEALAQGMPVITTPNTVGPDVLTDNVNGYVVPIRSVDAMAEKLEMLLKKPSLLDDLRDGALKSARAMDWSKYQSSLLSEVTSALKESNV